MEMRIRLPELMERAKIPTAYALAKASKDRISMSTAHRLVKAGGAVRYLDSEVLDVLCDVFEVTDLNDLLEREAPRTADGVIAAGASAT